MPEDKELNYNNMDEVQKGTSKALEGTNEYLSSTLRILEAIQKTILELRKEGAKTKSKQLIALREDERKLKAVVKSEKQKEKQREKELKQQQKDFADFLASREEEDRKHEQALHKEYENLKILYKKADEYELNLRTKLAFLEQKQKEEELKQQQKDFADFLTSKEEEDRKHEHALHKEYESLKQQQQKDFADFLTSREEEDRKHEHALHKEYESVKEQRQKDFADFLATKEEEDRRNERALHREYENHVKKIAKENEREQQRTEKNIKNAVANTFRGFAQIAGPIASEYFTFQAYKVASQINQAFGNQPWLKDILTTMVYFAPEFAAVFGGKLIQLLGGKFLDKIGPLLDRGLVGFVNAIKGINLSEGSKSVVHGVSNLSKVASESRVGKGILGIGEKIVGASGKAATPAIESIVKVAPFMKAVAPAMKLIPLAGGVAAGISAVNRFSKGDAIGGVIDALAGIAGFFPGIGTTISLILVGINFVRDNWKWFTKTFNSFFNWSKKLFGGLWNWFKGSVLTPNSFTKASKVSTDKSSPLFVIIDNIFKLISKIPGLNLSKIGTEAGKAVKAVFGGGGGFGGGGAGGRWAGTKGSWLGTGKAGEQKGTDWTGARGSLRRGELQTFAAAGLEFGKGDFLTDKPEARKDFTQSLKKAQDEVKKLYGKSAGFTLTGGYGGKHQSGQHAVGTAVDIGRMHGLSREQLNPILAKYGISHPAPSGDVVHYEFTGITSSGKVITIDPKKQAQQKQLMATKSLQKTPQNKVEMVNKKEDDKTKAQATALGVPSNTQSTIINNSTIAPYNSSDKNDYTSRGAFKSAINNGTSIFST